MRTCKCGKNEEQVEFVKNRRVSQCLECNKIYMKEYRQKNKAKLNGQVQKWKGDNKEKHRTTCREHYHERGGKEKHLARVCKTPRTWFSHLLGRIKATSKKPGPHDPKSGPKRDFDLDLDYVVNLWEEQNGKCVLTGIEMLHEFNNLQSASIDRIDSEQGHIKGNIQIVCQAINMSKRHRGNSDMVQLLELFYTARHANVRPFAIPRFEDIEPRYFLIAPPVINREQSMMTAAMEMIAADDAGDMTDASTLGGNDDGNFDDVYLNRHFNPEVWGVVGINEELRLISAAAPGNNVWFLFKSNFRHDRPWYISDGLVYYTVFPLEEIRRDRLRGIDSEAKNIWNQAMPSNIAWRGGVDPATKPSRPELFLDIKPQDLKFNTVDQGFINGAIEAWVEDLHVS